MHGVVKGLGSNTSAIRDRAGSYAGMELTALQREQRRENGGVRTAARIRVQRQQRGSLIAGGFGSGTETGSGAVLMARYYSRAAFGPSQSAFPSDKVRSPKPFLSPHFT